MNPSRQRWVHPVAWKFRGVVHVSLFQEAHSWMVTSCSIDLGPSLVLEVSLPLCRFGSYCFHPNRWISAVSSWPSTFLLCGLLDSLVCYIFFLKGRRFWSTASFLDRPRPFYFQVASSVIVFSLSFIWKAIFVNAKICSSCLLKRTWRESSGTYSSIVALVINATTMRDSEVTVSWSMLGSSVNERRRLAFTFKLFA